MIHFVTGNVNKFAEARALLPELERLDLVLPEIQSLDLAEVLQAKIESARAQHSGSFIIEDVAMMFDALNGFPGPFIKWFQSSLGNEKIAALTEALGNDRAEVLLMLGYVDAAGEEYHFEGRVAGRIVRPRGSDAFGFDPIFIPDGQTKTYGEMTREEKRAVSHRSLALAKLKEFLGQ